MADCSPVARQIDTAGFPASHPIYEQEAAALIVAAKEHPLGTEFLTDGHLEAVAVTFQVHAFTVDAARRVLRGE